MAQHTVDHVQRMKQIKAMLDDSSNSGEQKQHMLEELMDIVDNIDYARGTVEVPAASCAQQAMIAHVAQMFDPCVHVKRWRMLAGRCRPSYCSLAHAQNRQLVISRPSNCFKSSSHYLIPLRGTTALRHMICICACCALFLSALRVMDCLE